MSEFFERWVPAQRRGVRPLTPARAEAHHASDSYAVKLDGLVLTLRPVAGFVDLAFLGPDDADAGGVEFSIDLGGGRAGLSVVRTAPLGAATVRLDRRTTDADLTAVVAPVGLPRSFAVAGPADVAIPDFGAYDRLAALPRDPWTFVVLPDGFTPPG